MFFTFFSFHTTSVDREPNKQVGPSEIWHRFPKFILGFLAGSLVSSLILQPALGIETTGAIIKAVGTFKSWYFCLAFLSIGPESNSREMAAQMAGRKPMVLYVFGQPLNLILTLLVAWIALSGSFFPIPSQT